MTFADAASDAIRQAGGRVTSQRRLIIELLENAESHLDAERLYHQAYEQDTSVSLATVYRTLNMLADAHLIDQRYTSHDHTRKVYEPPGSGEHYHFTCQKCHRVIEFESPLMEAIRRDLKTRLGIRVNLACMCFQGLCADCAAEADAKAEEGEA